MVEFAVSLPILFVIVFGSIQICNALYLQQFVTEVSYQGSLQAMSPDSEEQAIRESMEGMLETRGITDASIEMTGLDGVTSFDSLTGGSPFLIRVELDQRSRYAGPIIQQIAQIGAVSSGLKQ